MRYAGISQHVVSGRSREQVLQDGGFCSLPLVIRRDEDFSLVLKPAIEGLRRESGTTGNPIAVRAIISRLVEFSGSGVDQQTPRIAARTTGSGDRSLIHDRVASVQPSVPRTKATP